MDAEMSCESWKGVPIAQIVGSQSPWGAPEFPLVTPGHNHSVLYHIPYGGHRGDRPPKPQAGQDKWDKDHVRMPCSSMSLYPIDNERGETPLRNRWRMIEEALTKPILNSKQLADTILSYNSKFRSVWKFRAMHHLFNNHFEESESEYFFTVTLPKIAKLALDLPNLIQAPIPLLKQNKNRSISLSQQQISSLLANAFFCTFPRRNTAKRNSEYSTYPHINFSSLYECEEYDDVLEKLKSLCHYFRRVCTKAPTGACTFSRRCVPGGALPQWEASGARARALPLHVDAAGSIEDAHGLIMLDFANKYLGGGVLGHGSVQEEIRFVVCPELMVSMLFTEVLKDNEALFMIGCERYSSHTGYSRSFRWSGDYQDHSPFDSSRRRRVAVLAIDALPFASKAQEYRRESVRRELNKAWIGFSFFTEDQPRLNYPGVATGNWGCGAFGGTPQLKSLIQLMACAQAQRPMAYYTFGDTEIRDDLIHIYNLLARYNVTVGQLYEYIVKFANTDARRTHLNAFLEQVILEEDRKRRGQPPVNMDTTGHQVDQQEKPHYYHRGSGVLIVKPNHETGLPSEQNTQDHSGTHWSGDSGNRATYSGNGRKDERTDKGGQQSLDRAQSNRENMPSTVPNTQSNSGTHFTGDSDNAPSHRGTTPERKDERTDSTQQTSDRAQSNSETELPSSLNSQDTNLGTQGDGKPGSTPSYQGTRTLEDSSYQRTTPPNGQDDVKSDTGNQQTSDRSQSNSETELLPVPNTQGTSGTQGYRNPEDTSYPGTTTLEGRKDERTDESSQQCSDKGQSSRENTRPSVPNTQATSSSYPSTTLEGRKDERTDESSQQSSDKRQSSRENVRPSVPNTQGYSDTYWAEKPENAPSYQRNTPPNEQGDVKSDTGTQQASDRAQSNGETELPPVPNTQGISGTQGYRNPEDTPSYPGTTTLEGRKDERTDESSQQSSDKRQSSRENVRPSVPNTQVYSDTYWAEKPENAPSYQRTTPPNEQGDVKSDTGTQQASDRAQSNGETELPPVPNTQGTSGTQGYRNPEDTSSYPGTTTLEGRKDERMDESSHQPSDKGKSNGENVRPTVPNIHGNSGTHGSGYSGNTPLYRGNTPERNDGRTDRTQQTSDRAQSNSETELPSSLNSQDTNLGTQGDGKPGSIPSYQGTRTLEDSSYQRTTPPNGQGDVKSDTGTQQTSDRAQSNSGTELPSLPNTQDTNSGTHWAQKPDNAPSYLDATSGGKDKIADKTGQQPLEWGQSNRENDRPTVPNTQDTNSGAHWDRKHGNAPTYSGTTPSDGRKDEKTDRPGQQPLNRDQSPSYRGDSHREQPPPNRGRYPSSTNQPNRGHFDSTRHQTPSDWNQPSSNRNQASSNWKQPSSNQNQAASNWKQPSANWNQPSSNWNQPSSNRNQPSSNWKQPSSNWKQPSSNWKQPSSNWKQPSSNRNQPSNSGQTSSNRGHPSSNRGHPSSNWHQPSANRNQPSSNWNQHSLNRDQPSSNWNQPSSNRNQPSNNGQPSSNRGHPYSNRGQPSSNWNQPYSNRGQVPSKKAQTQPNRDQSSSILSQIPLNFNQPPFNWSQISPSISQLSNRFLTSTPSKPNQYYTQPNRNYNPAYKRQSWSDYSGYSDRNLQRTPRDQSNASQRRDSWHRGTHNPGNANIDVNSQEYLEEHHLNVLPLQNKIERSNNDGHQNWDDGHRYNNQKRGHSLDRERGYSYHRISRSISDATLYTRKDQDDQVTSVDSPLSSQQEMTIPCDEGEITQSEPWSESHASTSQ